MRKTAMIRARIEPGLKRDTELIFRKLGITASEAINIYYSQVKLLSGIPFEIKIPNIVTRKTLENTDNHIGLKSFKSAKDLLKDLKK
jgi:DNA-damage-inducible protein J